MQFNSRGLRTIALDWLIQVKTNGQELSIYWKQMILEIKLDYIFTVDIFNEGIDIPRVNQIVMLRPTQSAIIFVQQLGRGLAKKRR